MEEKKKQNLVFGGKTKDFIDGDERSFEQAHLRAYLKAQTHFFYGYDKLKKREGGKWMPEQGKWRYEVKRIQTSNETGSKG